LGTQPSFFQIGEISQKNRNSKNKNSKIKCFSQGGENLQSPEVGEKISSNRQISILSNDTFKDFVFHIWFMPACQGLAKSSLGMTATLATKKTSPKKKKKKTLSYPPPLPVF
jgi:hypothetical protein